MRELSNDGVSLMHASETVSRKKRHGWTVVTSNGRVQAPRFIGRRQAVRLFQHTVKAG